MRDATPKAPGLAKLVVDEELPVAHLLAIVEAEKHLGRKILASCRAIGAGAKTSSFAGLSASLPRLEAEAQQALHQDVCARVEAMKLVGAAPDAILDCLAQGIAAGGDPSYLAREAARSLDSWGHARAALHFVRGALAIAPPGREWYRDTLALILMNLSRYNEAAAEIDRLGEVEVDQARWLKTYLAVLTQPFDYWHQDLVGREPAEDSVASSRSVEDAGRQASLLAGRIEAIVLRLRKEPDAPPALPDVSALKPQDGAPAMEEQHGVVNLLLALRKEWSRLCWLSICLGCKALASPTEIRLPPEPLDYLDTILSVRFNLLSECASGRPLVPQDELDEDEMKRRWGGTALSELAPHLAAIWLEETGAELAAIRWAKGKIDSVFIDQ